MRALLYDFDDALKLASDIGAVGAKMTILRAIECQFWLILCLSVEGRSFPLRLQPEFALALMVPTADSSAHRKASASATVGGGDDSVTQCHFFAFSPSSTSRRMASERPGISGWVRRHLSIWANCSSCQRWPMSVPIPVLGRPIFFLLSETLEAFMQSC